MRPESWPPLLAAPRKSFSPTTYTSEVSWNRMIACVSMMGTMLRKACGSTTVPIACQ
jgi:hypothetical protein